MLDRMIDVLVEVLFSRAGLLVWFLLFVGMVVEVYWQFPSADVPILFGVWLAYTILMVVLLLSFWEDPR